MIRRPKSRFVVFLVLVVGALIVAAPSFAAGKNAKLVQIGGVLVSPSKLSAWQANAGSVSSPSSRLVQIGGKLVAPSKLSTWQAQAGKPQVAASKPSGTSTSDGGFSWRSAGVGVVLAFASMGALLGVSTLAMDRRRRLLMA